MDPHSSTPCLLRAVQVEHEGELPSASSPLLLLLMVALGVLYPTGMFRLGLHGAGDAEARALTEMETAVSSFLEARVREAKAKTVRMQDAKKRKAARGPSATKPTRHKSTTKKTVKTKKRGAPAPLVPRSFSPSRGAGAGAGAGAGDQLGFLAEFGTAVGLPATQSLLEGLSNTRVHSGDPFSALEKLDSKNQVLQHLLLQQQAKAAELRKTAVALTEAGVSDDVIAQLLTQRTGFSFDDNAEAAEGPVSSRNTKRRRRIA